MVKLQKLIPNGYVVSFLSLLQIGPFLQKLKKNVFISITKENKYNVSIEWSRPPSIKGQITYNLNRKTYKLISKFRLGELKVIKKLTQINEFLKYGFINK